MAVLTYSSALQDRIAYRLWNAAYSTLTAGQKADIDGTSAANPPVLGVARQAYAAVNSLGQWTELLDKTAATAATTVSDAAENWFVDEACFRLAQTHRRSYIEEAKQLRNDSRQFYFDTVTVTLLATGYTADVYTLTPQSIRFYVLRRIIQAIKPTGGMGAFPVPEEIDATAFDILNWLWNSRKWQFRRRRITIDFVTASNGASPTINTASGETFGSLATQLLYYSDATTTDVIRQATAEQMASYKADTSAATGKPVWFRIQQSGDTPSWILHPYPDAAYTVSTEVLIAVPGTTTPGVPTSATDGTPYAKLPTPFKALFKELVLGALMKRRGLGEDVWNAANDQLERFAPDYDDHGDGDLDGSVRNVYHDESAQRSTIMGYGYSDGGIGGPM